jgi:glycogen synthase
MKVLMLSRVTPQHRSGGLESHTETLAAALKEQGVDISIVTSAHPDGHEQSTLGNVPVYHLPGTKPGEYTFSFFKTARRWIDKHIKENPVDIVHSQGFAALGFKLERPYRLVTTVHGTLLSETGLAASLRKELGLIEKLGLVWRYKKRLAIAPQYRRLLNISDRIITDSIFTQNLLPAGVQKKICVVRLGIPLEPYLSKDHGQCRRSLNWGPEKTCVSVGRITREKGFQMAIEAVSKLPDVKYYIVGTGPYMDHLTGLVKKEGLENRIIFTGRVSEEALRTYYTAADIFLMPELGEIAFGLVLVESMAAGTPVIAADSGAIKEVIYKPDEFTYNKHDPGKLAELIRVNIDDNVKLAGLRDEVRKYADKNYHAGRMAADMLEVYESLL